MGDEDIRRQLERVLTLGKEVLEEIGPRQAGRPTGARAFPDEVCDDLARQALALRSTAPPTPWADIERQLKVSTKTLKGYIRALPTDKKGSNSGG